MTPCFRRDQRRPKPVAKTSQFIYPRTGPEASVNPHQKGFLTAVRPAGRVARVPRFFALLNRPLIEALKDAFSEHEIPTLTGAEIGCRKQLSARSGDEYLALGRTQEFVHRARAQRVELARHVVEQ